MKTNYFLKSLVLVALMALFTNVKAAEFRVADGATDTELAAALAQAQDGDVIWIDGEVTINAMVEITKNVKIEGTTDNAAFNGGDNTRLFIINPALVEGQKLVFNRLSFFGGNALKNGTESEGQCGGGVAKITGGGITEFNLCYFFNNVAGRGGAFFIDNDLTTVTFRGCEAFDNVAKGRGNESRGGYLFSAAKSVITHEYCTIELNQSIGGRGGAICHNDEGTHRYYYTTIASNKGGNWSDDKLVKLDENGDPIDSGEYEGGAFFIQAGAITLESCAIIANQSWSHSSAIRSWGNAIITFINSTVTMNEQVEGGRAPIWTGEATYNFVNSFLVDNVGSNAGNGAGFDGDANKNVFLNVFNSVLVRNHTKGGDGAVDVRAIPEYTRQVTVKNSIIGLMAGAGSNDVVAVDNPDIPTKSSINMYKIGPDDISQVDYVAMETSGINFDEGIKYSSDFEMPYYMLNTGSMVTKLGDPALLEAEDVSTDMFSQDRTVAADGSIEAAPVLASVADGYDDSNWRTIVEKLMGTGIFTPDAVVKNNIRVIGMVSNGILGVDFGEVKGQTSGQLLSVAGQVVENVFNCNVIGKGYYNVHAAPGVYLLRVVNGGNTYVQKVIVK